MVDIAHNNKDSAAGARSAFTLIEVLVSVVILSVGIVTIIVSLESSVRALDTARDTMWCYRIASELLEETRLSFAAGSGPGTGMTSGMRLSPHGDYRWEINVVPAQRVPLTVEGSELMQVTATVWRRGGTGRRRISTFVPARPWSDGKAQ